LVVINGLRKDCQVSCEELDYLVDAVKLESSVLGARMMGGGFAHGTNQVI